MATEYLDLDDALDAYAEAVEVSLDQAKEALLNLGQLESALARPQNAAAYENADVARQAASLFWGVAANHAFRDGNKRTAAVLLRSFLNLNGYDISRGEHAARDPSSLALLRLASLVLEAMRLREAA